MLYTDYQIDIHGFGPRFVPFLVLSGDLVGIKPHQDNGMKPDQDMG